jgi:predicted kinase
MQFDALKKEIVIMIGMSFSGKSYHVDTNYLPYYQLVSKVHVLKHLKTLDEDPTEDLMDTMRIMVRSHMSKGLPVVVDQNNLSIKNIFTWDCLAREHKYYSKAVLIDTPFEVCMKRLDYACDGKVSLKVKERMIVEKEKLEELKIILNMKHQSFLKDIEYIDYYGNNEESDKKPDSNVVKL